MFVQVAVAQNRDSTIQLHRFAGNMSVTNNGISFIPTFSLGKPATIFTLSMGRKKWSFDPEFRASLQGKPWSLLFWWRYRPITEGRFRLQVGAHPALAFRTTTAILAGKPVEIIQSHRYLATELVPSYQVSKHLTLGIYYLLSHGFDEGSVSYTNFLTLNTSIQAIPMGNSYQLKLQPQVYYLKMDNSDGYYTSCTLTMFRKNNPWSFSALTNKVIHTNIKSSKDFVWNVSLNYSFGKNYVSKP